ncbi:hypothetical protein EUX98_g9519, partial [Antrodiella citrinella]
SSSQYTQPYAATDLGESYPHATGNTQSHTQGIEQSGNMLIMTLAHARISGDGTYINQYYDLLKSWANYLTDNTLTPNDQTTADLESQANMTNLAVKGIIGVRAMAEISQALGKTDDATTFANAASTLVSSWQSLALSQDSLHVLAVYGNEQSWTLPYNLYADILLQTNLISNNIYTSETSFLGGLLPESANGSLATPFGIPIDTFTSTQGYASWTMFTAAIMTNSTVRDGLIEPVWTHIMSNISGFPYSTTYKLDSTGALVAGRSSPALVLD